MKGVVHTHSFYSVLWSCLEHEKRTDVIPAYTPYLKMKVGTVGIIPYAKPGSQELFGYMEERIMNSDAYLLKQHGPVVAGRTILDAFYGLEELEESAKTAWYLRGEHVQEFYSQRKLRPACGAAPSMKHRPAWDYIPVPVSQPACPHPFAGLPNPLRNAPWCECHHISPIR